MANFAGDLSAAHLVFIVYKGCRSFSDLASRYNDAR